MKTVLHYAIVVFSVLILPACDRKPTETTETKQAGPVMELKEEVQASKSDTTLIQKDTTEKK